jgi:ABC-type glycerol-3-phosphate transport system permease component
MAVPLRHGKVPFCRRHQVFRYVRHALLLGWALFDPFPTFWMISTSFKEAGEWIAWPPHWLPQDATLLNYKQIFAFGGTEAGLSRSAIDHAFNIWKALGDSLLICSLSSLTALLLGTLLAYGMSRFRVGGRNFRYAVLTIRMVPPIVIAIPNPFARAVDSDHQAPEPSR